MAVLEVRRVVKQYEGTLAVDHISFSAEEGRIFGLLGPNGAGKTSTIRMITYITVPDSGEILLRGQRVGAWSQAKMGYMPEERGLYKKMRIGEQLEYFAMLKGLGREEARKNIRYWMERFDAADWGNKKTEELSKGMQQKIQFISTIAHDPELIILDEPFSGLDPINAELLREVILELKSKGKTILFASHRMEQVEQMCDDIGLIAHGKALLTGELRAIKRSFGRENVVLEFEGDDRFVDELRTKGLHAKVRTKNRAEWQVSDGTQAQQILQTAILHAQVIRFDWEEPSLNDIFIKTVEQTTV